MKKGGWKKKECWGQRGGDGFNWFIGLPVTEKKSSMRDKLKEGGGLMCGRKYGEEAALRNKV